MFSSHFFKTLLIPLTLVLSMKVDSYRQSVSDTSRRSSHENSLFTATIEHSSNKIDSSLPYSLNDRNTDEYMTISQLDYTNAIVRPGAYYYSPVTFNPPSKFKSLTSNDAVKEIFQKSRNLGITGFEDVVGDGACFFRSVSFLLYGTEQHHKKIRDLALKYMEDHPEITALMPEVDVIITKTNSKDDAYLEEASFRQYRKKMSQYTTFAQGEIILAVQEMFNVQIYLVSNHRNQGVFAPYDGDKYQNSIFLGFQTGIHYFALQPDFDTRDMKSVRQRVEEFNTNFRRTSTNFLIANSIKRGRL